MILSIKGIVTQHYDTYIRVKVTDHELCMQAITAFCYVKDLYAYSIGDVVELTGQITDMHLVYTMGCLNKNRLVIELKDMINGSNR